MSHLYVNMKSELSLVKRAYEAIGFRCYRVRTECQCSQKGQGNLRDGLIVLNGDRVLVEIIRCKGCTKHPNL